MMTATVDISGFNKGMANLVNRLHLKAPVVIKKECGELMKTLVRFTPPTNLAKTRKAIAAKVNSRFEKAADAGTRLAPKSGEEWFYATPEYLFGVAPDKDMRKATVDQLRALYFTLTPKGAQIVPFQLPRKVQQVRLVQNVIAKAATIAKLKKRFWDNIGRLKAAWWVAWPVTLPTGSNMPPQWVTKHVNSQVRGRYIDKLGVRGFPTFSIGNFAQGTNRREFRQIVQRALATRSGAMGTNLRMFLRGKKKLSDYATP